MLQNAWPKTSGVFDASCREQLDASYDKLKALRQEEAALLGELAAQQASTSSSADKLAGLQAQLEEAGRRKVWHMPQHPRWQLFDLLLAATKVS